MQNLVNNAIYMEKISLKLVISVRYSFCILIYMIQSDSTGSLVKLILSEFWLFFHPGLNNLAMSSDISLLRNIMVKTKGLVCSLKMCGPAAGPGVRSVKQMHKNQRGRKACSGFPVPDQGTQSSD